MQNNRSFCQPALRPEHKRQRCWSCEKNKLTQEEIDCLVRESRGKPPKLCAVCGQKNPGEPCTFTHLGRREDYGIVFLSRLRTQEACSYCGVPAGSRHHLGCIKEICPECGGTLKACACEFDLLTNMPEENVARLSAPLSVPGKKAAWSATDPGYPE